MSIRPSMYLDTALAAARAMADRHKRHIFDVLLDVAATNDIDSLVGYFITDAYGMRILRWPHTVCEAANLDPDARPRPRSSDKHSMPM